MANPYPVELRERAVRAFEDATETYEEVAARFSLHVNTLVRWVQRVRETGSVGPERQRGWLALTRRHLVAPCARQGAAGPNDRRTDLGVQPTAGPEARVHRSSIPRTLQRSGYVFRPLASGAGWLPKISAIGVRCPQAPAPGSDAPRAEGLRSRVTAPVATSRGASSA